MTVKALCRLNEICRRRYSRNGRSLPTKHVLQRAIWHNNAALTQWMCLLGYISHIRFAAEIAFEISQFHTFHTSVTLDWVIQHTIMYHSLTSIYIPNYVQIRKTFCGWRTDGRSAIETRFIRSTRIRWNCRWVVVILLLLLVWHAPLGVRSAKRRHQSPEWTILSHSYRLIQWEIVWS